jgi:hypothetical protein
MKRLLFAAVHESGSGTKCEYRLVPVTTASGCTADEICSQHFLLYMTVIFGLGEETAR